MRTPDVTLVQIVAIVSAAVNTLLAFGVDLSATQQHVLVADAGVIGALLVADGVIRNGRSRAIAAPPKEPTTGGTV